MSTIFYDDITRIRILPLDTLRLQLVGVEDVYLFRNPVEGSSLSMKTIKQSSRGVFRTVGFRIESQWFIPYDDFDTMNTTLYMLATKRVQDVTFTLAAQADQPAGAVMHVDLTDTSITVREFAASFDIVQGTDMPRMQIDLTGIVSPDILAVTGETRLFQQVSGF